MANNEEIGYLIDRIINGTYRSIVVLTGAGISTNAGIPDYRSSNGLFNQLIDVFPEASNYEHLLSRFFVDKYRVFDHPIFLEHLEMIEKSKPTTTHYFCKWLYDRGWLKRVYTQNIDGLHSKVGLPNDLIVECHGNLFKNNVVLYGDDVGDWVKREVGNDFWNDNKDINYKPVDLVIVFGTSLQVAPFCALPNVAPRGCTRIVVNTTPNDVLFNNWTKRKVLSEDAMYGIYQNHNSSIKLGYGHCVTLRPSWNNRKSKYINYLIESDCDIWCQKVLDKHNLYK